MGELNPRPYDYQSYALPTELIDQSTLFPDGFSKPPCPYAKAVLKLSSNFFEIRERKGWESYKESNPKFIISNLTKCCSLYCKEESNPEVWRKGKSSFTSVSSKRKEVKEISIQRRGQSLKPRLLFENQKPWIPL